MESKPTLAFAGLGAMGGGMAKNLVKNGFTVYGCDVYQPLVDSFVAAGGKAAKSPREAAAEADFFISMVANVAQNSSLLFEGQDAVIHGLRKGKTFILCSTTPPTFVHEIRKRMDEEFSRSDIKLLDCPVSGGTLRAADGTLSIFESGPDEHLDAASSVLQTMSGRLYRMGSISSGTKTKTVHQLCAATNIITASEAMGLAATIGLNTQAVFDHVLQSDGNSFMFENRVPHMLQDDWHPYSALSIILKDTTIVTDTARRGHFPTHLADKAEQLYLQGVQSNLMAVDDAAMVKIYLPPLQGNLVSQMTSADVMLTASYNISKDTIVDLLAGIHLAAAVECMAFAKHLDMSRHTLCEIITNAAGWTPMFTKYIPPMLEKDLWTLADCPGADEVGRKLAEAVGKCQVIKYPCPMAVVALHQYNFAALTTKTVEGSDHKSR